MLAFYENNELKVALFGKLVVSKPYFKVSSEGFFPAVLEAL